MHESGPRSGEDEGDSDQEDSAGEGPSTVHNLPSSSRQMRNIAEKNRRDKLNAYINEMASLVPMVSSYTRRANKTNILRLCVTYLRIHNILIPGTEKLIEETSGSERKMVTTLINHLKNMDLSKFVMEEFEGLLLIVSSSGKIVFVSHTIEQVLGHQQIDLFGKSMFSITHLEDHDELRRKLSPVELECLSNTCTTAATEGDADDTSNSETSSSCGNNSPSPAASTTAASIASSSTFSEENYRRSFYLRLQVKPSSGNDQPKYELVHVVGHLRVPTKKKNTSRNSKRREKDVVFSNDEVLLVAMIKPCKEQSVTDLSLLEATRDEYITRHLVDGRIVYTDHRIAVVAGYMPEEVTGITGFRYMHKDDVRWTMIGLRQMYYRGESYGKSCYRLQTKIGQFIYLRTQGYLEFEDDNETVRSFVCINSLVSEDEGEKLIKEMKQLFAPLITEKQEPGIAAIAESHLAITEETNYSPTGQLEDPNKLQEAINNLISPPANPGNVKPSSPASSIPDKILKLTLVAKRFPSVLKQSSQIDNVPAIVRSKDDPKQKKQAHQVIQKPVQEQNRQSVIRLSTNNRISESSDIDMPLEVKRIKTNEGSVPMDNVSDHRSSNRVGVVVTHQIGTKRQHLPASQLPQTQIPQPQSMSPLYSTNSPTGSLSPHLSVQPPSIPMEPVLSEQPFSPTMASLLGTHEELMQFITTFDNTNTPTQMDFRPLNHLGSDPVDHLVQVNDITNELYQGWGSNLEMSQRQLESRIQHQETQMTAIEENIQTAVSVENINDDYMNHLTKKLKAQQQELNSCYKEHKEQRQELRTLQQDTLSIQQNMSSNLCPDVL